MKMNDIYKSLGGNGIIQTLMRKLGELPIKEPGK